LAILLALVASPALSQDPARVVGDWTGALQVGAMKLRLVLHITRGADGVLRATMDSIDQNALGIPIDDITFDGTVLRAELRGIRASYEATVDPTATTLTGNWKQSGTSLPLVMARTDDAASLLPKRPQEPKPPFPYQSRDVTYPSGDITLAGTLTIPADPGPHPAAVLISGSGPQDRDEGIMGHKPFLVLADHLTRHGIAVLRADDRGVGESTGSFADATTEDFAADAAAGIAYLETLAEIDSKRIGLVGHSEGGITAPMVAARSNEVAFIVLMAGVGVPMDQLLRAQSRLLLKANGADDEYIARNERLSTRMFAIAKAEPDAATREAKLRDATKTFADSLSVGGAPSDEDRASLERGVAMLATPWMHFLLNYDPAATLRRVKAPVLAINGELDLQVPPSQNLPAIQKALADGGNRDVTIVELPKLNHLFQTATTGAPSEYGTIEETMAPIALKTISDWIVARTGRAKK
jgi:pimeloyl-ACP methyl ester carboxylesterase